MLLTLSTIQLFSYLIFPACPDFLNHLIIYLSDIFGASNIVNYSIIQLFDISSMSNVLNHLIVYLSDIFFASDIVNYSIIQLFDISSMSNILG